MKYLSRTLPFAPLVAFAPPNDEAGSAPATETEAAPVPAKDKRAKVSNRIVLDKDGEEADSYIDSYGFKYESLSEPGTLLEVLFKSLAEGKRGAVEGFDPSAEQLLPLESIYALAAFGGLTLAGNVTNTIRNGEPKADGPQTEREALEQWIADLMAGNWTKATGEIEPGLGLLAQAVARTLSENDKKDRTADEAVTKVKDWLTSLDKDARKKWRADVRV